MTRGTKVEKHCLNCGAPMLVREADVKRGWGKFCSKACKASEQARRTGWAGPGSGPRPGRRRKHDPRRDGIWRSGQRVLCSQCDRYATNGVIDGFQADTPIDPVRGVPIVWFCDHHFDDTHPLSSDAFDGWQS